MIETYHDVEKVKQALEELTPSLPEIMGRGRDGSVATFGKTFDLPVRGRVSSDSVFAVDERILSFTEWFIGVSHENGELHPNRIRGYVGVIGDSGQMLDYLHTDPVAERVTATIATAEAIPSTRTFPHLSYSDPNAKAQLKYLGKPSADIPDEMFEPQVSEGGLVHFALNQMHCEAPLQTGTAKIFLSADYKY